MADSVLIDPGQTPSVNVATDEVAGIGHVQKFKMLDPTPDSSAGIGIASNPLRVDPTGSTAQPVSGTVAVSGISGSISLPSGAATSANQTSEINLLTTIDADTSVLAGAVSGSEVQVDVVTLPANVDIRDLTSASDSVAAVQSGTWTLGANSGVDIGDVTINNASGGSAVNIQDGGNSITVDGAVAATQSGTWTLGANSGVDIGDVTINNASGGSAVNIQDGGNSITVDGTVTANPTQPATPTTSNVSGVASSTTILASNASRKSAIVYNDSTAILYLLFGSGTASATSYTYKLFPEDSVTVEAPVYTGQINGIWASATGAARVTELT